MDTIMNIISIICAITFLFVDLVIAWFYKEYTFIYGHTFARIDKSTQTITFQDANNEIHTYPIISTVTTEEDDNNTMIQTYICYPRKNPANYYECDEMELEDFKTTLKRISRIIRVISIVILILSQVIQTFF